MRTIAVSMFKIANDIRWLGSGRAPGSVKSSFPKLQPGGLDHAGQSQSGHLRIGDDGLRTGDRQRCGRSAFGGASGNFEINLMMPVVASQPRHEIELLAAAASNLATQCIAGLRATEPAPDRSTGLMIVTALRTDHRLSMQPRRSLRRRPRRARPFKRSPAGAPGWMKPN